MDGVPARGVVLAESNQAERATSSFLISIAVNASISSGLPGFEFQPAGRPTVPFEIEAFEISAVASEMQTADARQDSASSHSSLRRLFPERSRSSPGREILHTEWPSH